MAASLPAAAGLGTTKWELRLTPEPAPLGAGKGMQSWFGEQCRVCPASPPHFWGRNYCGTFRKLVSEEISLRRQKCEYQFSEARNRSHSLFASSKKAKPQTTLTHTLPLTWWVGRGRNISFFSFTFIKYFMKKHSPWPAGKHSVLVTEFTSIWKPSTDSGPLPAEQTLVLVLLGSLGKSPDGVLSSAVLFCGCSSRS